METTFELYNTATEMVITELEMTPQFANTRNQQLRSDGSDLRYIQKREAPAVNCSCGAELKFECVCDFSDYE